MALDFVMIFEGEEPYYANCYGGFCKRLSTDVQLLMNFSKAVEEMDNLDQSPLIHVQETSSVNLVFGRDRLTTSKVSLGFSKDDINYHHQAMFLLNQLMGFLRATQDHDTSVRSLLVEKVLENAIAFYDIPTGVRDLTGFVG